MGKGWTRSIIGTRVASRTLQTQRVTPAAYGEGNRWIYRPFVPIADHRQAPTFEWATPESPVADLGEPSTRPAGAAG
jgi:hypothetical protein